MSTSSTAHNLGVLFDDNLTLQPHVTAVCKTVYYQIHRISHIRKFLTSSAWKTIVHSLVASRLDYCNSVVGGLPDNTIHKLQSLQNSAARLVSLEKKTDHITPIVMELHGLPVHQCILFKILVVTKKALHGLALKYITDLIKPYILNRSLRLSTQQLLDTRHKTQDLILQGPCFLYFCPC